MHLNLKRKQCSTKTSAIFFFLLSHSAVSTKSSLLNGVKLTMCGSSEVSTKEMDADSTKALWLSDGLFREIQRDIYNQERNPNLYNDPLQSEMCYYGQILHWQANTSMTCHWWQCWETFFTTSNCQFLRKFSSAGILGTKIELSLPPSVKASQFLWKHSCYLSSYI